MSYAPTITLYTTPNPAPRAEVLFTSFAPGTVSVDVWREADGRRYRLRGGVAAAVAGSLTRIDNEIPFNTAVTYWAEMFDEDGVSLGQTSPSEPMRLWCTDTWVHNPLAPAEAFPARFARSAGASLVRPASGTVYYPQGRRVGVVIASSRGGIAGAKLDLIVDSLENADKFQSMLGGYDSGSDAIPVLCFRKGSIDQIRLPNPFFAAVLNVAEVDITYRYGESGFVYEMEGDEVSPPAEGITVPLLTRADLNAWYQTRAALDDDPKNVTRLDVNRRYDLAGTA